MKRLFLKIALLFAICFLVDRAIGYWIGNTVVKYTYDKRIKKILEGEIKSELIILGSSHAAYNYRPQIFERELSKSTYNFGFIGSSVPFHCDVLKLVALTDHTPEYVIINLDGIAELQKSAEAGYRIDALYPYVRYDQVNKMVSENSEKEYILTLLSRTYRQNQNFKNALHHLIGRDELPDKYTVLNQDGSTSFPEGTEHKIIDSLQIVAYDQKKELVKYRNALLEMIRICEQHEIKPIFVIPPMYKIIETGVKDRIEVILKGKYRVLDFSQALQDPSLYHDNDHFQEKGAIVFSRLLAKELKPLISEGNGI